MIMGLSVPWSPKVRWGKSGTESDESSRDPSTVGETSLLVTSFSPPGVARVLFLQGDVGAEDTGNTWVTSSMLSRVNG